MDRFLEDAASILETAEQSIQSGHATENVAVLRTRSGGVRIICGSNWSNEALRIEHDADTIYRVTTFNNAVRLEGHQQGRSCLLQAHTAASTARLLRNYKPPLAVVPAQRLLA